MKEKKKKRFTRVDLIIIVTLLLIIGLLVWMGRKDVSPNTIISNDKKTVSYEDYNGKKIGILTGTNMEKESFDHFPDSEYFYYDGYPNLNTALENGSIDAYLGDEAALKDTHSQNPNVDYIKKRLKTNNYSFAFRKNDENEKKLCDQLNEFLKKHNDDGTIPEMFEIWFGDDDSKKTVDMSGLTGENGTIHLVTTTTDEPFSYIKDGKNVGYDIDVTVRFCREYGYELEIGDVDFQARIPALQSGKYDFTTSMNVTPEREEEVMFSDPVSDGGVVVAVRSGDLIGTEDASEDMKTETGAAEEKKGFWDTLVDSFNKTFIREARWKLIVSGIGMTCLITVLSMLFGTILAFLITQFRRTDSRLANPISNIYVKLLQGTPTVVLLMILYYVLLGKTGLSAMWVAVVGFTLNLGAYGSEIMRSGINSIDPGQREAALALGFNENQAYFGFVFPNAMVNIIPVYRGEVINMLKSTSVVGYIAIQDITKMSDIIRSRTFEAFFPLLVTALIYFILAWIIAEVLKAFLKRLDPKTKKRRIKGVKMI
ncbi:MAG: ABC transporter permease subunit [Eubacterium sp.]|nr:ABC transporter permease subunit [Eubacterium sp.]